MGKKLSMAAAAYKLVWFRVVMFALLPSATMFVALTKDMTPEKWDALGQIGQWRFWMEVAIPGALGMVAFIDNSLGRAKEESRRLQAEHNARSFTAYDL